jgi:hypothetical protein
VIANEQHAGTQESMELIVENLKRSSFHDGKGGC